ncbi:PPC domain-containing DNA-binding protein [Massilia aquatica]|uniref:DNA-binding protein n=1 Tax=Massilia aquatica TaxID=2609000 RepID=A0ABX0M651_9BURK|nr:PPC domain-containing DNA-binding protein [Massilia aquatica]NHZ42659.1 DNA-binding protein [Massilia aquatica]
MKTLPLRLMPGQDLRATLAGVLAGHGASAGFVVQGIGSLLGARLRLAGAPDATELEGDIEILTLAGSLSPDGPHLHMALADANGRVMGGHVLAGCTIRTTAEILIALLPDHRFAREPDAASGFDELVVHSHDC